jgi:hypothetical protein
MVLEQVANTILDFVNYGITILIILLVIEIFKFIGVGNVKAAGSKIKDWKKLPAMKSIRKRAHRAKVKELNEYVREQKEAQHINLVETARKEIVTLVQYVRSEKNLTESNFKGIEEGVNKLDKQVNESLDYFKKVTSATRRQERKTGKLIKALEDNDADVTQIKTYEAQILAKHDETKELLNRCRLHVNDKVLVALVALQNSRTITGSAAWPIPFRTGNALDVSLKKLQGQLDATNFKQMIVAADKAQHEAIRDVQGILAKARPLWES